MRIALVVLVAFFSTMTMDAQESVSFTLRNTSVKSVQLWIPSVMNPNLSPMSNSGVTLKVGQKVYFKYEGKKKVLFIATGEEAGLTLDVPKLIRERKKELAAED